MTSEKIEGTIVFDGLLQGRLNDDPAIAAKLRQWVSFLVSLGVRFSLEVRDSGFNLLPESGAASTEKLGDAPAHTIEQAIGQLVDLFPESERAHLFSTLRSSEYRKGEEVQTLYTLANGQTRIQSRTLQADTVAPPQPLSTKERVKVGVIGVLLAVGMLGIALLFPGVRAMFGQVAEIVKPLDTNDIKIDVGPYAPYITAAFDEKQSDRTALVIKLKRTKEFPKDEAALNSLIATPGQALKAKMAVENLARGYLHVELFDADGGFLASGEIRIADLAAHETLDVKVPLPQNKRTAKVAFVL
jgi:hypothetical protein